ncbi:MAG: hypothetical protein V1900_01995 [Candidatus Aenigmatarchaeota archaeon]
MTKFAVPGLSIDEYFQLSHIEFDELCKQLYQDNKKWLNETLNDPVVHSVLVTSDGRILKSRYDNSVLTAEQVRDAARIYGSLVYQLSRPTRFLDVNLYFQDASEHEVLTALERSRDGVSRYKGHVKTAKSQSGSLEKLSNVFIVGRMEELIPSIKGERYEEGATVAYSQPMEVFGWKRLHIASQSAEKVHQRNARTMDEREPGKWLRIERLHRFDDPVLDMFDTYDIERLPAWPGMILYKVMDAKKPPVKY